MSFWSRSSISYARFVTRQNISASTDAATHGSALGSFTTLVYVYNLSDATAFVLAEDDSTPGVTTTTGFPIASGAGHYLEVTPGQYVGAILASGSGTVAVCEMGK